MSATIDRATGKPPTAYTPPEDVIPCPTCTGRSRETVGMVCQTCGTDYGAPATDAPIVLTDEQRARFTQAADAALRVRRNILLLAAHATHHMKQPHGDSCEDCGLHWPCVTVMRAAGPSLNAVADLPSQSPRLAAQQADLIAAITALRDRARDPKHGGRVTVHEITALLPEEHR